MSTVRSTTNGTLKSYNYNLQRSTYMLNQSRDTVLTQRNFNSFAEDPAAAARCFQLRRSYLRTESQHSVGFSVVSKYEMAWSTLDTVVSDVDNRMEDSAYAEILSAINDPTGAGRNALGQSLVQLAESVVQSMNCTYGDNFVFAGADGLDIPFTWEGEGDARKLYYRGIPVDTVDSDELAVLDHMVKDEKKYADIGLGLEEDESGNTISTSAYNVALQGISFLGYGTDDSDGNNDPNNIASIIYQMGRILLRCDSSGAWDSADDQEKFSRLAGKFQAAADLLSNKHTELDTQAAFLKDNQSLLEDKAYTLQEQFLGIEDVDLAEAISAYSWAQYCYNAALKVGNSILSESLMDYISI